MEEIDIPSGDWTLVDQEQYRVLLRERDQFRALCDIKDAVIARIRAQSRPTASELFMQDKTIISNEALQRLEGRAADATKRAGIAETALREARQQLDTFKASGGCDTCQAGKRAAEDALDVSMRDQQILKNRIAKARLVLSPTVGFNVPSPGYTSPNELTEEIRKGLDNPFWKA